MSRSARRLPWRLVIGALALAMLGLVAPRNWPLRQAAPRRPLAEPAPAAAVPADEPPRLSAEETPQPAPMQLAIAPVGPLVAEQIDLDPSLPETPSFASEALTGDPAGGLHAPPDSLVLNNASASVEPRLVDPFEAESLAEPSRELAESPLTEPDDGSPAAPTTAAWSYPAGLVEQLNLLSASTPAAMDWAERVKQAIDGLVAAQTLHGAHSARHLELLAALAEEGRLLASSLPEEDGRSRVLRAGYSIYRRLNVWNKVHALATADQATQNLALAPIAPRGWPEAVAPVEERLAATGAAANWRTYLLLDEAQSSFESSASAPEDQQQLARDMLYRLHSTQLSQEQTQFLCSAPFQAMTDYLVARAASAVDLRGLLATIEDHEHDDASRHARALADHYDRLRWATDPAVRELAETVNAFYRNANVRVALSAALINRMIPAQQPQYELVQDNILGADVYGQSFTNTQVRLVLIPDATRWNIGLEANGAVASDTTSSKGPARFLQKGVSFFRARKRVTVDREGIRLFHAEAGASANNELQDFETRFDGIPLFGDLARSFVRSQYDESQPAAREVVEGKIRVRATSQLDREVAEKLEKGKRDFQSRFMKPLQELALDPTTVDMETTLERLIGRLRLAGRDQIAAHTPRPQAPGDSLLSVQLHESAFNNALENLELEGRRVELHELFTEMTNRFDPTPDEVPVELPEDVFVTFADEDAVRIDCQDGRVRLTIRLKELAHKRNSWKNFTVRGYYAPNADQLDANLVREGIIELIGDNHQIRIGDQIALRGIFSRVLSKNRKLSLVNRQIAESPELRDQQVTQFVIHDGWIGIALGPKLEGREPAMHPRPLVEEETGE